MFFSKENSLGLKNYLFLHIWAPRNTTLRSTSNMQRTFRGVYAPN